MHVIKRDGTRVLFNPDKIVNAIRAFAYEFYQQKSTKTLLDVKKDFPDDAMKYNRNR